VSVALQYLNAWLSGNGAVAIFNLMEDAATAEISRAQLWQWITNRAKLEDGRMATGEMYKQIRDEELKNRRSGAGEDARSHAASRFSRPGAGIFRISHLPAYRLLE